MKKYLVILAIMLPLVASGQTASSTVDVQSLIKQLQEQIQLLQNQVLELQSQVQSVKMELAFTRALTLGTAGDDVTQLQKFLKTFPDVYPEGLVTGYFGPLTEAAVKRFQEQNGIESVGIVGPKTREKLNALVATIAVESPSSSTAVTGQAVVAPSSTTTGIVSRVVATSAASIAPVVSTSVSGGASPAQTFISSPVTTAPSNPTTPPTTTTTTTQTTTTSTTPATTTSTATSTTPDTTPPSTPIGIIVTAVSNSQINISWTASTDDVWVVGYKIYRGGSQIFSTGNTSYSDTGLAAGTTYSYTVLAYDIAGNNSPQSAPVSATTFALQTPWHLYFSGPSTQRTNTPYQVNVYGPAGTKIIYDWGDGTTKEVAFSAGGYVSTPHSWTTAGTFSIRIKAKDAAGLESGWSDPLIATIVRDSTPPSVPNGLSATAISPTQVNLSWGPSSDDSINGQQNFSGVAGYKVYQGSAQIGTVNSAWDPNNPWSSPNNPPYYSATTISYSDSSVHASSTYAYTVSAFDFTGNESGQSVPATVSF